MRYFRVGESSHGRFVRYDGEGNVEKGGAFVGEDGILRWFSEDQLGELHEEGISDPAFGCSVFSDGHSYPHERLA